MPLDQDYIQEQVAPQAEAVETPQTPTEQVEMFELALEGKPVKVPTTTELSFIHDGKPLKVPYSKLINTYRQGQNYEDKFRSLKEEREKFTQESSQYKNWQDLHKKYGAIQEWSEKSPDEFKTIWDMYQNRDKHLLQNKLGATTQAGDQQQNAVYQPFIDEIAGLKNQLRELSQFKSEFDKQQETARQREDASEVKNEIQKFQNDFPELNLKEKDPEGVALWAQVLNYGIQNQMPNFRTAALSYFESRLGEILTARARNNAVKTVQSEKKQGIVAKNDKPSTTGKGPSFDPKKVSYDQLAERAKAQYESLVARSQ
jgi:hypothetical protein